MRMRLYSCLITVALLCYPYVVLGDAQSHRKAAETLLIVMEVDKSLPQIANQVVETQLQQNPQLASQREVAVRIEIERELQVCVNTRELWPIVPGRLEQGTRFFGQHTCLAKEIDHGCHRVGIAPQNIR